MDKATRYTLLVAVGQSPQVITEAAWSLAYQHVPPLQPSAVEVVATGTGEGYARALLLGESRTDERGRPIEPAADRWTPFCTGVLGLDAATPVRFNVATFDGRPLFDVETPSHDALFADVCYETVERLTRPGAPPVYGVISGGRKTMSAHLMTAFSVYARPCDHLVHVMLAPPRFERDPTFYHPTDETADLVTVHRVHPRFPRLRRVLEAGPLRDARGTGLRAVLDALEPLAGVEEEPDAFVLALQPRGAELCVLRGGRVLGAAPLSPARAATFAVIGDAILRGGGEARAADLYADGAAAAHVAHRHRDWLCGWIGGNALRPWTSNADVSKAVHDLSGALERTPVVGRYLAVKRRPDPNALVYRWPAPLPAPVRVTAASPLGAWPFEALPGPD